MANQTAYIALGGNLGDRDKTLRQAVADMAGLDGVEVRRLSHLIETEPVGGPAGQGKYLNGVVEVATSLPPMALLDAMHTIETSLGRDRSREQRWGSRTCDLDILMIGDLILNAHGLTLPHPQLHLRKFVLVPLVEIAPSLVHPVLGKTMAQLLAELEAQP